MTTDTDKRTPEQFFEDGPGLDERTMLALSIYEIRNEAQALIDKYTDYNRLPGEFHPEWVERDEQAEGVAGLLDFIEECKRIVAVDVKL